VARVASGCRNVRALVRRALAGEMKPAVVAIGNRSARHQKARSAASRTVHQPFLLGGSVVAGASVHLEATAEVLGDLEKPFALMSVPSLGSGRSPKDISFHISGRILFMRHGTADRLAVHASGIGEPPAERI